MPGKTTRGLTPGRAVALAAAAGAAVTLISLLPVTSVAYRSVALHVAIETAATLVALLCGALLLGRFLRAPTVRELVLAASVLLLGLTNLCFAVVPWVADADPGSFDTWAPVAGRLVGAAGLAAGSFMGTGQIRDPRRALAGSLAAVFAALSVIGIATALLASDLPVGIDPGLPPDPAGPDLVGEPALLVAQAVSLVLYSIAALGFARRGAQTGDELMSWLAAAAAVAAFSRLNYFLFPSLTSEWVYTGDFLRLGFYALILAGVLREIAAYQRRLAEAAVVDERRRIARDLHDGLAQELAFIRSQAGRLPAGKGDAAAHITEAAERALDESRHAIDTLARPVDARLDSSVAQAAEEVAMRDGIRLTLDLERGIQASDAVHEALTRIVREALSNAIRHGGARSVAIRLVRDGGLSLTVQDDGEGLPQAGTDGRGFGLVSMRERAQALGGTVEVFDRDPGGACLEVRLP